MADKVRKFRYFIFLKDVLILALSAFGGPQAHLTLLLDRMVVKRAYLSENDLIELTALCQILPGPTSTQTIVAIGYKIGGARLAYLTLFVWTFPACTIMTAIGIYINYMQEAGMSIDFTKFIQPMAVGFIAFAAYRISKKVITTKTAWTLFIASSFIAYFVSALAGENLISSIIFPCLLLAGGLVSSLKYQRLPKEEKSTTPMNIDWRNFILYLGVFALSVVIGNATLYKPVLLFENFYRNGSLIFGGGQVLIPLLKVEFVDYKQYLSNDEFLSGLGFVQSMPGPVFSLSGYIGALSMREYGIMGQIAGGFISTIGIFLPGTFLIFFVYKFWDELKKYRPIKAAIEGVNAVACGMVTAAAVLLFMQLQIQPTTEGYVNTGIVISTFVLLSSGKIPAPFIIIAGLIFGIVFSYF